MICQSDENRCWSRHQRTARRERSLIGGAIFVTGRWQQNVFSRGLLAGRSRCSPTSLELICSLSCGPRWHSVCLRSMSTGSKQQDINDGAAASRSLFRVHSGRPGADRARPCARRTGGGTRPTSLRTGRRNCSKAAVRDAAGTDLRQDGGLALEVAGGGGRVRRWLRSSPAVNPSTTPSARSSGTCVTTARPTGWCCTTSRLSAAGQPQVRDRRAASSPSIAVTLIDVKGTHGRIEVAGGRWYPSNRQPFRSPVEKLRGHARALKGNLSSQGPEPGLGRRPGRDDTFTDVRLIDRRRRSGRGRASMWSPASPT